MRVNCELEQAICDGNFEGKSRALSFSRPQTLVTLWHRWLTALCEFFVAPGTFPRQRAKTFDTAAILRDGGAKTTNNCSLSGRILRILLGRNGVATLGSSGSLLLRENLPKLWR